MRISSRRAGRAGLPVKLFSGSGAGQARLRLPTIYQMSQAPVCARRALPRERKRAFHKVSSNAPSDPSRDAVAEALRGGPTDAPSDGGWNGDAKTMPKPPSESRHRRERRQAAAASSSAAPRRGRSRRPTSRRSSRWFRSLSQGRTVYAGRCSEQPIRSACVPREKGTASRGWRQCRARR